MSNILLFLWMLPQNILGLGLRLFVKVHEKEVRGRVIFYKTNLKVGSVSLGKYIYLCESHWESERIKKHEYGHFLQGIRLGWLFLFVIGIPSIIWAGLFKKYRAKNKISYYSFYTEAWANKLGKVEVN